MKKVAYIMTGLFLLSLAAWWFFGTKLYDVGVRHGRDQERQWVVTHLDSLAPAKIDTIVTVREVDRIRIVRITTTDTVKVQQDVDGRADIIDLPVKSLATPLFCSGPADSVKVGDLFVRYFFPPVDKMEVEFQAVPWRQLAIRETVTVPIIKTVERKKRWNERPWPWIALGVLVGSVSVELAK